MLPQMNSLKRQVNRIQSRCQSPNPTSMHEIEMSELHKDTTYGELFLMHSSGAQDNIRILIYTTWTTVVVLCSVAKSYLTLWDPVDSSMPAGFAVLHHLLEFALTHVHWVSDAIQSSHPLLPPSLPALSLCQHQGVFQESTLCIRWPKYWNFSISPSNEYSGLISFRIEWLDFLAVQGTLKGLFQHHSSKASILWHSAFSRFKGQFHIIQLWHL